MKHSTAFHQQTDSQAELTIQTLEGLLWAFSIDFKGNKDYHPLFIEFAYNNRYHSSIAMAPSEALYGRRCTSQVLLSVQNIVYESIEKVQLIRDRLKMAQSR